MMRGLAAGALCASLTLFVSNAEAAVLNVNGDGQLTGATGVVVNGTGYDVTFLQGTCIALYNGCDEASDFLFGTADAATAAAQALLDQVFLDGPLGNFDTQPNLTLGVTDPFAGFAATPFTTDANVRVARNSSPSATSVDGVIAQGYGAGANFTGHDRVVYAVWSLAEETSAVPLPAAGWMLLAGLGGFGLIRRRG